ncbi:MAG: hypothetical protein RL021_1876 [Bacteroidota bacterium]|jgi:putative endonuclease
MDAKTELARLGEELAARHLAANGYKVMKHNFRIGQGEIDLIVRKGEFLVFVEVKTRTSPFLTDPVQLVPLSKQRQLVRLADRYMKNNNDQSPARFDVVIVVHNSLTTLIEHIEDAFYPMG